MKTITITDGTVTSGANASVAFMSGGENINGENIGGENAGTSTIRTNPGFGKAPPNSAKPTSRPKAVDLYFQSHSAAP